MCRRRPLTTGVARYQSAPMGQSAPPLRNSLSLIQLRRNPRTRGEMGHDRRPRTGLDRRRIILLYSHLRCGAGMASISQDEAYPRRTPRRDTAGGVELLSRDFAGKARIARRGRSAKTRRAVDRPHARSVVPKGICRRSDPEPPTLGQIRTAHRDRRGSRQEPHLLRRSR